MLSINSWPSPPLQEYPTALKLYLKVGEKEIDHAIEVVGRARNDSLTHILIDYLMGETDNVPKDKGWRTVQVFFAVVKLLKLDKLGDS